MTSLDTPRVGYYGKLGVDKITGKIVPQYPIWKTYRQMYCVSLPLILLCTSGAAFLALLQFWIEDRFREKFGSDSYLNVIPSIAQSTLVAYLSGQFEKFSTWLTDLENHRTQNQYERHR